MGYHWPSYKWMSSDGYFTKYCQDPSYGYNGFTDTKTVLDAVDDAASNGNSIFLPAAGTWISTNFDDAGSYGYYRSSSLLTSNPFEALYVSFTSGFVTRDYYHRRDRGLSVRPVYEE